MSRLNNTPHHDISQHNYLINYSAALVQAGYTPVAINADTKIPLDKGWTTNPVDDTRLRHWEDNPRYQGAAVGILANYAPAIDLDIKYPALTEHMASFAEGLLGVTNPLRRIGEAPKCLIPCQALEPFKKMRSPKFLSADNNEHQVEILGRGNQWLAFGIHEKTGQPYQWVGELPARPQLPILTPEIAQQIINEFTRICRVYNWLESSSGTMNTHDAGQAVKPPVDIPIETVEQVLDLLPNDGNYDEWVGDLAAIHHQTGGSPEGLELAIKYSEKYDDCHGPQDTEEKWNSFDVNYPGGKTFGALMHKARDYGFNVNDEVHKAQMKPVPMPQPGVANAPPAELMPTSDINTPIIADQGVVVSMFDNRPDANNKRYVDDIIDGLFKPQEVGVIVGTGGTYKSYVALDIAFRGALEARWEGRKTRGHISSIFALGEGYNTTMERKDAWLQEHDVPLVLPDGTGRVDIYNYPIDLHNSASIDKLEQHLMNQHYDLVFFDTFASQFSGDSNQTKEVAPALQRLQRLAERYDCCIIIVHHEKKTGGFKGAGDFKDNTDFTMRMVFEEVENEKTGNIALTNQGDETQVKSKSSKAGGNHFLFRPKIVKLKHYINKRDNLKDVENIVLESVDLMKQQETTRAVKQANDTKKPKRVRANQEDYVIAMHEYMRECPVEGGHSFMDLFKSCRAYLQKYKGGKRPLQKRDFEVTLNSLVDTSLVLDKSLGHTNGDGEPVLLYHGNRKLEAEYKRVKVNHGL